MKRVKRSPYGKMPITIEPVRVEGCDTVYFAKMPTTPDTDPIDLQELQRSQAKISALIFAASARLAAERGISSEDARTLFFTTASENVDVVAVNFMDYLNTGETEELLLLQGMRPGFQQKVATMMMQRRLAFQIQVQSQNGLFHQIEDPWFDVNPGDSFRFGLEVVSVKSTGDAIEFSKPIQSGEIGFLSTREGEYILGDPNWSEAQTRTMSIEQIAAIHKFYEGDESHVPEDTGKPDSTTSIDSSTPKQLTGGDESTQSVVTSVFLRPTIDSPTPGLDQLPAS